MGVKAERIISSLNLELWIWEYVAHVDKNRSRFFSNLIKEEIKKELVAQKLMTKSDVVTELYGELYLRIILNKRNSKKSLLYRKPVRSKTLNENPSFKKKAISIRIEKWLWDISGRVLPNRSLFIKKLILNKIRNELISTQFIQVDSVCELENSELYIMRMSQKLLNRVGLN